MKIALVSPYDFSVPGGVNSHIAPLAENFQALGHQVRIIAPASRPRDVPPGVIVVGRPIGVPASGSVARIALSLRLAPQVKRVLAQEEFDIVHIHEPFMPFLPVQFLRYSEAINVATFHAAKERDASRWYAYGRRVLRRWFRRLDGKIAVSVPAMRLVSRYFPGYFNVIPNGVDVAHFSAPVELLPEYCDGRLNILFVGRLEKRKGVAYLLRAYTDVKNRLPQARLIIVGPETRLKRRYQRIVREAGLKDVVFAGYASYEDLPRYHQTAHVFCAPATGNESQGIVLLEAMAAGTPIVASNIDGYASVLTHGVEGLLVLPKETEALADALVQLLSDEELRKTMSERGRLRAQEFSWERISQRVLSYYERLLHERQLTLRAETSASLRPEPQAEGSVEPPQGEAYPTLEGASALPAPSATVERATS